VKHIGLLSPERLISLLNWVGIPVVILYLVGMFAYPWIACYGSGYTLRCVGKEWQRSTCHAWLVASLLHSACRVQRRDAEAA